MAGFERYAESEIDPLLRSIAYKWTQLIRQGADHKKQVFGNSAEECANFFNGPKSWSECMSGGFHSGIEGVGISEGVPAPDFQVCVNKTFEFVTIFGPSLYYENPVRTVKPRAPVQIPWDFFPDPMLWEIMMQQENMRVRIDGLRGVLLETMLNWSPSEFRLDRESRAAIDEALIKGRGCLWTELYQPPGTNFRCVRSKWESVDDLIIDPDATSLQNATWIARHRRLPSWQVERDYGLRRGSIRGNSESQATQALALNSTEMQYDRKRGLTNDLLDFYQVWSKMGLGGRLWNMNPAIRAATEPFGDYSYLVVAESIPFPLNCPPDVYNDPSFSGDKDKVFSRFAWPTPFWSAERWPVACLDFHVQHNCPWPFPHLKAGMGELKFLNWAMSFLIGKIRTTSRDFIAIKKSAGEEIKTAILEGKDLTLLELEADHGTISELVGFLQHPAINGDIWKIIAAVEESFDKRVGLNELMYGQGGATQIRSAAEFQGRNSNMNVRPADMAKQVEAWATEVAANEGAALRYHLRGNDVQIVMGEMGSYCWNLYVATTDLVEAFRQLEFRIEAGSTRRPNKELEVQTMSTLAQTLLPLMQQYSTATGDVRPLNNLVADYVKALSLDPSRYQLSMPMQQPEAPGQPSAGGINVQQPENAQEQQPGAPQ